MTIDRYDDSTELLGGIYSLPVIGNALSKTRQFCGAIAPGETDSTEVRFAKEMLRCSLVVGWAAVGVLVVYQPGDSDSAQ